MTGGGEVAVAGWWRRWVAGIDPLRKGEQAEVVQEQKRQKIVSQDGC